MVDHRGTCSVGPDGTWGDTSNPAEAVLVDRQKWLDRYCLCQRVLIDAVQSSGGKYFAREPVDSLLLAGPLRCACGLMPPSVGVRHGFGRSSCEQLLPVFTRVARADLQTTQLRYVLKYRRCPLSTSLTRRRRCVEMRGVAPVGPSAMFVPR